MQPIEKMTLNELEEWLNDTLEMDAADGNVLAVTIAKELIKRLRV